MVSLGVTLNVLKHWDKNQEVISKPVVQATSHAADWLHNVSREFTSGLTNGYRSMVNDATNFLADNAPEVLRDSIRSIGGGYGDIGAKVLGFLDPVGFAADLGGDVLDSIGKGTNEKLLGISKMLNGDVESGAKQFGRQWLGDLVTGTQVGLSVLPAGHIAGKVARVPLKAAKKELKATLKTTTNELERKALKHDIHVNTVKQKVIGRTAKAAGFTGKQRARDYLADAKRNLNSGKTSRIKSRDWDLNKALTRDDLVNPVKSEVDYQRLRNERGEQLWNKENWKRR